MEKKINFIKYFLSKNAKKLSIEIQMRVFLHFLGFFFLNIFFLLISNIIKNSNHIWLRIYVIYSYYFCFFLNIFLFFVNTKNLKILKILKIIKMVKILLYIKVIQKTSRKPQYGNIFLIKNSKKPQYFLYIFYYLREKYYITI